MYSGSYIHLPQSTTVSPNSSKKKRGKVLKYILLDGIQKHKSAYIPNHVNHNNIHVLNMRRSVMEECQTVAINNKYPDRN